jgi:hypothetical protein
MTIRTALSALALTLTLAAPAQATLIVAGSVDGGGTIFAVDNSLVATCGTPVVGPCQLPDLSPVSGLLVIGQHEIAGNLLVLPTVQTADVATVPGTLNRLDSTGTQFTNNDAVAHTVSVAVGATDFQGPAVDAFTTGAGQFSTLGGALGDTTITMRWYNDPANQQGGLSPGVGQPGTLIDLFAFTPVNNPQSFSHNGGPFAVSDPDLFSMTLQFDAIVGPGVRLTGREQTEIKPLVAVPLPSALWLLGAGCVGAAAWARRAASRRTALHL